MRRVTVFNAHRRYRIRKNLIAKSVRTVLNAEHRRQAAISVVLIDGGYCRRINKTFLGHDRGTDVISFPMESGAVLEGEVYVNLDRARVQAHEYGVPFMNEVTRLVVHGVLHLIGYDDGDAVKKKRMRAREDALVKALAGTS